MQINKLIIFLFVFFSISCSKVEKATPGKVSVKGFIQKGPFSNGSSVTISELNSDLSQTGKNYSTQITNNVGYFQVPDIQLESKYISIKADGFYYNEVAGKLSVSQITLYALSDITDKASINVNILTHLEKPRVEYLIKNGKLFSDAKKQAEQEVLKLFNINKDNIDLSENLNITQAGDDNAILLAISIMLQGNRSEGELTELLSNISNGIKEKGYLNSSAITNELTSRIKYLSLTTIRNNIAAMYTNLEIKSDIPNFESYVPKSFEISYPLISNFGLNVLTMTDTVFKKDTLPEQYSYSFAAFLPDSTTLEIRHSGNLGWAGYHQGTLNGWNDLGHDDSFVWRTLKSNRSGLICAQFQVKDTFTINYYENGSSLPVRVKKIKVK